MSSSDPGSIPARGLLLRVFATVSQPTFLSIEKANKKDPQLSFKNMYKSRDNIMIKFSFVVEDKAKAGG